MKRIVFTTMACALALGLTAGAAQAQQDTAPPAGQPGDHPHGGRGFDTMDANHDGFVTLDEWKSAGRREERFAQIDADHDGKITREEMRAFMEKMRAEHPGGRGPGGGGNWGGGNGDGGAMQPPQQ